MLLLLLSGSMFFLAQVPPPVVEAFVAACVAMYFFVFFFAVERLSFQRAADVYGPSGEQSDTSFCWKAHRCWNEIFVFRRE